MQNQLRHALLMMSFITLHEKNFKTKQKNSNELINTLSLIAAMARQEESTDGSALSLSPHLKKTKLTIPGKCIIFQTDKPSDSLRKGKDLSVHTLKSAQVRQDKIFKRVSQDEVK